MTDDTLRDDYADPPDDVCVVCGRPATTEYEGEPSCGRAGCELRIQAAADYHADRGG